MSLTLFLGHGKTEMRGGPAIFTSLYNQWKHGEKYIIYEKSYTQSVRKLIHFLRNKKLSTLILENEYFTEVFLALFLKILNRKMNIYGPAYHIPSSPGLGKGFLNSLIHYMDYKLGLWFMTYLYSGIYTENSYMKNYIKSLNPEQNVILESPGIKKENIISLNQVENFVRDIDFLYLTSMTKNKGIYDFLEVIKQIQKEHNIKVVIAGYTSPEVMDYINGLIRNNSIKNIELYQDVDEDTKYKLYSRSRIYVLPSIEDGIPITFYEAWSYGDLVIAYNLKTYSDIKDYFIGVKKGDLRELIEKCMEVYENYGSNFRSLSVDAYNYSLSHSYINGINNIIENIEKINKTKDQVQ